MPELARPGVKHRTCSSVEPVFKEPHVWDNRKQNREKRQSWESPRNDDRAAGSSRPPGEVSAEGSNERKRRQPNRVNTNAVCPVVMAYQKEELWIQPKRFQQGEQRHRNQQCRQTWKPKAI